MNTNQNQLELLNNALRRITELENVSVSNLTSGQNQTTATVTAVQSNVPSSNVPSSNVPSSNVPTLPNTASTPRTSQVRSFAEEMHRSFPSLANLRNSTNPPKKKRKQGSTATSTSKSKEAKPAVYKDLVLIPDPERTTVLTHSTRILLEGEGYVIHSFPFVRDWDNIQLKKEIEKVFPRVQPFGFVYMKVGYSKHASTINSNSSLLTRNLKSVNVGVCWGYIS